MLFMDDPNKWTHILAHFNVASQTTGLHMLWSKTHLQNVKWGTTPHASHQTAHCLLLTTSCTWAVLSAHVVVAHQRCSDMSVLPEWSVMGQLRWWQSSLCTPSCNCTTPLSYLSSCISKKPEPSLSQKKTETRGFPDGMLAAHSCHTLVQLCTKRIWWPDSAASICSRICDRCISVLRCKHRLQGSVPAFKHFVWLSTLNTLQATEPTTDSNGNTHEFPDKLGPASWKLTLSSLQVLVETWPLIVKARWCNDLSPLHQSNELVTECFLPLFTVHWRCPLVIDNP